ncbi:MAG: NUDIX domain-containing protein [Dehalococcoidia bacterium]
MMLGIRFTPLPWRWKRFILFALTPKTLVVASAIVPDGNGRVLLLRTRYSGRWIPPGGGLHPGENPADGLMRECREELGQDVSIDRFVGVYAIAGTGELFILFRCAPIAAPPRLSPEHEDWRYVEPAALPWWLRACLADADQPPGAVVRTLRRAR